MVFGLFNKIRVESLHDLDLNKVIKLYLGELTFFGMTKDESKVIASEEIQKRISVESLCDLDLDIVIYLYLGNISFNGIALDELKEVAGKEIEKRGIEYLNSNNIKALVTRITEVIAELKDFEKNLSFIGTIYFNVSDDDYRGMYDLISLGKSIYDKSNGLKIEYNNIKSRLMQLWENDPGNIRHKSKYNENSIFSISQQGYFVEYEYANFLTGTSIWKCDCGPYFRFDNIKYIIATCKKSDICVLPIFSRNGSDYELGLIFNFIVLYDASKKDDDALLWIVFFEETIAKEFTHYIKEDISGLIMRFYKKTGLYMHPIPYTVITQNEKSDWDYDLFFEELEHYSRIRETRATVRQSISASKVLNFI